VYRQWSIDTVGYNYVKDFDTTECRKSSRAYSRQYETNQSLQVLAAGLFVLGTVSLAASAIPTRPFVVAGETAFWTDVIWTSVGAVMLIDRRRQFKPAH
jgi:uncharacterized membrane-anchored protein